MLISVGSGPGQIGLVLLPLLYQLILEDAKRIETGSAGSRLNASEIYGFNSVLAVCGEECLSVFSQARLGVR